MTRRLSVPVTALSLLGTLFGSAVPDTAATPVAATVMITDNAPPVAVDDPAAPGCDPSVLPGCSFPIPEDWGQFAFTGSSSATANDTDPDGSIASWEIDTPPGHGDLEWLPNQPGIFGYTPDPDYNTVAGNEPGGDWVSDSFTYHVIDNGGAASNLATYRFWIAPINDAPTFVSPPSTVSVHSGNRVNDIPWAGYASAGPPDESGQHVDFVVDGVNTHGLPGLFAVGPAFTSDGHLTFTPAPSQLGIATVTVHLHDDGGLEDWNISNLPVPPDDTSDPITFDIVVSADGQPDAVDDTATIAEDAGAIAVDVLANDTDPDLDALAITGVTNGTIGTVAITGGGTGLTYTPNANANGLDSFTYTIADGNGETATAAVHVTIMPVDDAPNAASDAVTVTEDQTTPKTVLVLANDSDVDGGTLHVTAKTNGSKGVVTIAADGLSVAYKPNANAFGSDSFTYTVDDGNGGSAIGTVNVTITAVNDPPNAVNDGVPTPFPVYLGAGATAVPVLANDTWLPDAPETLTIIAVTQGGHGTVTITGGGTGLTYLPAGSTTGIDVFTYTISDGHGQTDRASVQVTVGRDLTPPTASITILTKGMSAGSTRLLPAVSWTLAETGSGLRSQLLQRRVDSGSWETVTLASLATREAAFAMSRGHTYTFRIRATDRSGNVGSFATTSSRT